MMENNIWKECKLGDCSNIITGFPFKSNEYEFKGELRVVRGENVTIGSLRWDSEKYWNKETELLQRYFLNEDDIVIGMDGSRVGQNRSLIKTYELPLILAQRVARIRAKQDVCQLYLWYNIYSNNFKEYVEAIHTGTSIPHISLKQIQDFEIQLPPLPEQKAIASVLSSLDDKIDLLHQQNQTLEALAETLFRQWFIEEAKEDWEEGKLGDLVLSANTGLDAIRRAPIVENYTGIKCLRIQDISQNKIFDNWGNTEVKDSDFVKAQLKRGDIIMARTCSPGILLHVQEDLNAVFNNGLARIRANENSHPIFLKYLFKTNEFINHIYGISDGTAVQLNMKLGDLLSYDLKIPPINCIEKFVEIVSEWDDKILSNQQQIQTLTQLRDTLLPKLMSGEVRVKL